MAKSFKNVLNKSARQNENGSATTRFMLVLVMLFLAVHAGYNYLIVWSQCTQFQDAMKEAIDRASMSQDPNHTDPEKIKNFLRRKADENSIPLNAVIKVNKGPGGTTALASFTREVAILPFNLYNYKYEFNHTQAPPGRFMTP
jgi:Flp pilus assembly protein TadG